MHLHAIWDLMASTEDDEGLVWAVAWLTQLLGIVQAKHDERSRELARFGRQMPEMHPC